MKEPVCKQHTRIAQCSGGRKQYSLELHSSARYLRYAQKASHRQYDAQYNTQSYRLMKEEDRRQKRQQRCCIIYHRCNGNRSCGIGFKQKDPVKAQKGGRQQYIQQLPATDFLYAMSLKQKKNTQKRGTDERSQKGQHITCDMRLPYKQTQCAK